MNRFTTIVAFFALSLSLSFAAEDSDTLGVYKVLFQNRSRVVLPVPEKHNPEELDPDSGYKALFKNRFPEVQDETIDNYQASFLEPDQLTSKSDIGSELIFVNKKTLNEIFFKKPTDDNPDAGWRRFKERFSCERLSSVSNIGFNKARDQALVFRNESYGSLGAEGVAYFLVKKDGKWIIKGSFVLSIS